MKKKQFLQFRRAMATLLAVAMIGQGTVVTTAENFVVDTQSVVAEEQPQEPEVQIEEAAEPVNQEEPEVPAEPVEKVETEAPAEAADEEETEAPAEAADEEKSEVPEEAEKAESEVSAEAADEEKSEVPEEAEKVESEVSAEEADQAKPEEAKEILYYVTFDEHAADFGKIQVCGEEIPVENISSYKKEVKENESFVFSVKANEGYEVENVCLANTQADIPRNADGLYEIQGVTKDEKVTVTYKAVAQEQETESEIALMSILPEETAVAAYEFWDIDGQTIIDTQYIAENDKLLEPRTPTKDGAKFIGWYVDDSPVIFGENITGVQNGTIVVKPKFEEVHYVFFHNPAGEVVATKEGIEGDVISTADVTFGLEADQSITGWYTSNDYAAGAKVNDTLTLQKGNVDLFAKVENGFWITYDSDGGKYFAPEFYVAGQTVTLTNVPAKMGYTFTGWFDQDGNEVKSTDKTVRVKAKWEANKTADYTVIYWQQKVTDSQAYAYVESGRWTGNTGDTVDANTSEVKKDYPGFEINNSKSTKAQIAADGSTIINVYYDRVLCTVNYYVDGQIKKTVTGLYGTDLKADDWWTDYYWYSSPNPWDYNRKGCILLTSYDFETAGYAKNAGNTSKNGIVNVCNFYGQKNDARGNVYYYNEQADGSFKLVNTIKMSENGTLTIHEKYAGYDLYKYATGKINQEKITTAGFWENQKKCQDGVQTNSNPVYIASTLKSYQLCYSNGGVVEHRENIKYTVSLNGCESKYTPARPDGVDPNYVFTGWYSDRECTALFDFTTTMPATNVIVYAGWKAPDVTVTAHENESDPGTVIAGIKYNDTINEKQLPEIKVDETKEVFLGWFTKNEDGSYTPWSFETKIRKNIDLYAKVIRKGTFTVSYDVNGGTGTVEDTRKYTQGAKADIQSAWGLTAPSNGSVFLYWNTEREGTGTRYYPNDKIVINENITLFAIWGCAEKTTLIYDGNGGTYLDGNTSKPQKTIADIKNNEKITLGAEGFTRTGYKLVGWSKEKNNSSSSYLLGENIIVNKNDPENVLYAVWEKEEYTLTIKYVYGENGSEASKDYSDTVMFEEEYSVNSPEITGYTADKPVVKGTMPAENLTVTVTYTKRGDYKYTVHYYWNGTTEKVSNDKVVKNQSYNASVTENPEMLNGYTPVSETAQTITLDTDSKEITFYYYKNVELTANSDHAIYDGKSHTVSGYTGVPTGVKFKDEITVGATGINAGDYPAKFTEDTVGKTDLNEQYMISKAVNGNLHIDPITDMVTVAVTEHSGSGIYNGTEQTVTGYDVTNISNTLYTTNDFKFSGNDIVKGTHAGSYNMELKEADFENISKNFTNVKFAISDGILEIAKRQVTIEAKAASKAYGNPDPAFEEATMKNNVEGELGDIRLEVIRSDAGDDTVKIHENVLSIKDSKEVLEKEYTDYTFTIIPADFTISENANDLTVSADNVETKYDGKSYGITAKAQVKGKENENARIKYWNEKTEAYDLNESPRYTDVTNGAVTVKFEASLEGYKSVQGEATVTVNKRSVILTSASGSKVYDGTPLTRPDVTIGGDGFIDGEVSGVKAIGSVLNVSDKEVRNEITFTAEAAYNAENYSIEYVPGTLRITPVTEEVVVTVTENSDAFEYDGTEKQVEGYKVTDISYPVYTKKDFTISENASQTVKATDAGTYDMNLKSDDFRNINDNFAKVTFKIVDGTLKIDPREITIEAGSATKKYDGTPLINAEHKIVKGLLAAGQTELVSVEGSQILVGVSANVITAANIFAEIDGEKVDVTKNYVITPADGKLEVTDGTDEEPVDPDKVITKNHDESKSYDLGDTVIFIIRVTNIYDTAKDITITELPGVVLEGAAKATPNVLVKTNVPAGETITVKALYKVTERDIVNGSFVNRVKAEFEGGRPFENTDTVSTADPERRYTITKKAGQSTHANGMFKAGETIHYTLNVTNTGNQTLENVEITDTLNAAGTITNIQGAAFNQNGKVTVFTISSLVPKAEATITYDYVVQEADKGNIISNAVVGTPANPDGEKPGDNTENPVENPKLEVKKEVVSITSADGTQKDKAGKADLNDTITYSVTVTNTGNVKLVNVKITDSLEGIQVGKNQSLELGTLEAGEAKTVTYTYQVKESDLGKSILNTAAATGDVPENPDDTPKPEGKDEIEVPTEDPANCSITVNKRLTNIRGELLAVRAADFYVTLFADEAMTKKAAETKRIHFDENQGISSVRFDKLKRGIYYVAETDEEGRAVAEGTYNNGSYITQYQAGNKVEITENGTEAQFQFDNQFVILPDEYYVVKAIAITKNVVKKNGEDLKSDETFYAGIFKDEDCTQLADGVSQNIVPLAMNGESTVTANVEVTVPVGGEEIKLYVTEVTADGTPAALSDTFEYDVEINDGFITLSETSENAAVTIINTSRKEEPEPTAEPTEATKEPTKAPNITEQPEEKAVTVSGVKTGDDSPITQLAFILFASSAAIMLVIFLRKKDEKDMMN